MSQPGRTARGGRAQRTARWAPLLSPAFPSWWYLRPGHRRGACRRQQEMSWCPQLGSCAWGELQLPKSGQEQSPSSSALQAPGQARLKFGVK